MSCASHSEVQGLGETPAFGPSVKTITMIKTKTHMPSALLLFPDVLAGSENLRSQPFLSIKL